MTSQFDRLLKEMETEVKRLAVLRKEFKQEKDPARKVSLKRMIDLEENERSSRYCRARRSLIRLSKASDQYEDIKAEIKRYDRKVRIKRIKVYPPIIIGEYASTFVLTADQYQGVLEFKSGKVFRIARDANVVWDVVRVLVTATGDGYAHLEQGWQGPFSRDGKDIGDSEELVTYIHAKQRGRGGKGLFILKPTPRDPVPRYEG